MADRGGGVFLRTVFQERLIDCRGADLDKRSQRSPLPFPLVPGSAGTRLTRHLLYPAYILVAWNRRAMIDRVSAFLIYPAPVHRWDDRCPILARTAVTAWPRCLFSRPAPRNRRHKWRQRPA